MKDSLIWIDVSDNFKNCGTISLSQTSIGADAWTSLENPVHCIPVILNVLSNLSLDKEFYVHLMILEDVNRSYIYTFIFSEVDLRFS